MTARTGASRAKPATDYHKKPVVSARMDAGTVAWARDEAERRGQPFGDFMDGLITAERDRAASRPPAPVAASQEQPKTTRSHAQTCKCGTCQPKEGKR